MTKKFLTIMATAALVFTSCAQKGNNNSGSAADNGSKKELLMPKDSTAKLFYALGVNVGEGMQQQLGDKFDMNQFEKGLKDAEAGTLSDSYTMGMSVYKGLKQNLGLDEFDTKELVRGMKEFKENKATVKSEQVQQIVGAYMQDYQKKLGERSLAEGKAFLEKNKNEKDVVTLPDGLQYIIEKEGTGEYPSDSSEVEVHYVGTLIDGTEFDSSIKRNQPARFRLNQVIKGWGEGITKVKEGGKIKLFIPSELGYKDQQMPGSPIKPNSTLIFDVELIKIIKPEATPAVKK